MVNQTWIFVKHFLKNGLRLSLQGKERTVFVFNGNIQVSK